MKKLITILTLAVLIAATACKKTTVDPGSTNNNTTVNPANKIAPDGFNFNTSKNIVLNLTLQSSNGTALPGVIVSVYDPANTSADAAIFKGVTDANGNLTGQINVPAALTQLVVDPSYLGLLHYATAAINNGRITATIGGPAGYSGDIVPQTITITDPNTPGFSVMNVPPYQFAFPLPYTSSTDAILNTASSPASYGVPKYLETVSDVIAPSLLTYVNSSLPEGKPVTTTHPAYLSGTATSTINVTATADVWITFVTEGAGNLNSLAYYTYTTGNPPNKESDIKNATFIFPNCSLLGSGGGLSSGMKVKLGTFQANTSIGFILIGSGWTGGGINVNATRFYSDAALNPETVATLQKHSIVLYDNVHNVTLFSFEDLNRQSSSCDNDFNDVVFYATSNPVSAISNTNVSVVDKGSDTDGDGVIDALDAFPNDPTRAYITYYPSQSGWATIAFEDNFPQKGDYDMNDMVLNYRYTFVTNAQNQVVTVQADYNVAAAGASYKNGFGLQLPIAASAVQSVTGQLFKDNYIKLAGNGVEAGQTNAVIIPFDNADIMAKNPDNSYFVNTLTSKAKVTGTTASVLITLTKPIAISSMPVAQFNPFLISNERRGYEIHLSGYAPTNLADLSLFGTQDDASVPAQGKYYISGDNWPWAMNFTTQFTYPIETVNVTNGYLHFLDWAKSGGTLYTDWYSNTAAGYRNLSNLYTK